MPALHVFIYTNAINYNRLYRYRVDWESTAYIYELFGGFQASIFGGVVVYGTYCSGVPDRFSLWSAIHLCCGRLPSRVGGRSV